MRTFCDSRTLDNPTFTSRSAQRAKIEELVTVDGEEAFRCNISESSGCDFVMSYLYHQLFARHFRKNHPGEAKRHGFFDEFLLLKSAYG